MHYDTFKLRSVGPGTAGKVLSPPVHKREKRACTGCSGSQHKRDRYEIYTEQDISPRNSSNSKIHRNIRKNKAVARWEKGFKAGRDEDAHTIINRLLEFTKMVFCCRQFCIGIAVKHRGYQGIGELFFELVYRYVMQPTALLFNCLITGRWS